MILQIIESLTKGVLKVGNQSLLDTYKTSRSIGMYTFIHAIDEDIFLLIDSIPFVLKKNHIVSLIPDQYFSVKKTGDCNIYQFNREFYCIKDHDREVNCMGILFYSNIKTPVACIPNNELERFNQIHRDLVDEFENKDSIQAEMLRVLLKNLIIRTTRLIKEQTQYILKDASSKNELLRQFNILVETHFRKEHGVGFYAEELFKSPKTLSNSFKEFETTPLQIIHDRLLLEIKRLLMYSDISIKEITFNLNFLNVSAFSKFFKKKTGQSPIAFKEKFFFENKEELT